MDKLILFVIVPDTPENLIESIDGYTTELAKLKWWQFIEKKHWRKWIVRAALKRRKLSTPPQGDN